MSDQNQGWWSRVDFDVLDRWRREGLNPADIRGMLMLSKYARTSYVAFPSNETLGEDLGTTSSKGLKPMSERGVDKFLDRLAKLGKVHAVYRDKGKRHRAGIVLLDRESAFYPIPSIGKRSMTAAWVDAVKEKDCRNEVQSKAGIDHRGTELQFHTDRTLVQDGWNSSSIVDGTPVPQNKDALNKDSIKEDNQEDSASSDSHSFSREEPLNGEALSVGLIDQILEARDEDLNMEPAATTAQNDVPSGPRINDQPPRPLSHQALPAEALRAIQEHAPDLLDGLQLETGRIMAAVRGHADVVATAAWEIRQARFTGREIRDPVELFISKCRTLADAMEAEGKPAPPFPDLATFQVVDGPHENEESELRRCWSFIWDAWRQRRLCEEFVRHHRRLPIQWWKQALAEAAGSAGTVGSMLFVIKIAETFGELGTFNERLEKTEGADGFQDGWKATLKERGIEHAPAYPWQKKIVDQSRGNKSGAGAI